MQENFIGESYYSLADLGCLSFDISGLRRKQRAISILTWRHSIEAFKISDEVTFIGETNASDDLFHAEKCSREQRCRLLHTQCFQILRRGDAGDRFEEITEIRR